MTTTYTPEVRAKLKGYLATHDLPKGLGKRESACSIAAINLALTGDLTDKIPDCMSEVLGSATIVLQDFMPHEMRNSDRYKAWLPTAAGTGRDHEQERLDVLMDWMWGTVLPHLQGLADSMGFGSEWRRMCEQRTESAAVDAAVDAAVHATDAPDAAYAAYAAASAASYANSYATDAAADAAEAAAEAAYAAARAAARDADFWDAVDPIGVLERVTKIGAN